MTEERLFSCWPTPSEAASLRAVNRARALTMFDADPADVAAVTCPACGGLDEGCTCGVTGAEALELGL